MSLRNLGVSPCTPSLKDHLKFGNKKLPSSTVIFNLGPAGNCPSYRLGFCQAFNSKGKLICYALRDERYYPPVLPYRKRQAQIWQNLSAAEFACQVVEIVSRKKTKVDKMRINEASDFRNQADLDKAEGIAKKLKARGITTYCYTARKDLDFSLVKHLVVNGSGFKVHGEFKMIPKGSDIPKGYNLCPMNCKICDRCAKGKQTVVYEH